MTDAVTSVAPVAAPPPTAQTPPASSPAPASAARAPDAQAVPGKAAATPQRQPLTVDVQRDQGVFVYTLRDPVTDTVLAVIPREAVRADRDGRHVDQRV